MQCGHCSHECEEEAIFCSKCSLPLLDAADLEQVGQGYANLNRQILEKVLPDHLRILGYLGEGGMATVYEVYDTRSEQAVALKVLPLEKAAKHENVARFKREAKLVSSLQHPHIVPFYASEVHGGFHFFTMALMRGGTLTKRIGKGMPWQEAVSIVRKVALALDYAHERGIVHRDIKPDNVMFDENGQVMLSDFGIAKGLGNTKITATQVLMGTPAYISPEQILGKPLQPQADLYALGSMFFHMLAGRPPFTGEEVLPVITKHLNEDPPVPSSLCTCPTWLDQVVLKLLAKDPDQRYATAAALIEDLQKAQEVKLQSSDETGKQDSLTDPTLTLISQPTFQDEIRVAATADLKRRRAAKGRAKWLLLAALLVSICTGALLFWQREPEIVEPIVSEQPVVDVEAQAAEAAEASRLERLTAVEAALELYPMAIVPDGSFKMGSWMRMRKDEMPIHRVSVGRFRMGKFEVTQELWQAVMSQNPSCEASPELPVHNVSWNEVQRFIETLNQLTGRKFRLPTEAEWEYASRAEEGRLSNSFGKREDRAWYLETATSLNRSGLREANDWGFHDMLGNLWEWCADYYDEGYYEHSNEVNPQGPATGSHRVVRGGAWNSEADDVRHANRHSFAASERDCTIGFRLAESLDAAQPSSP